MSHSGRNTLADCNFHRRSMNIAVICVCVYVYMRVSAYDRKRRTLPPSVTAFSLCLHFGLSTYFSFPTLCPWGLRCHPWRMPTPANKSSFLTSHLLVRCSLSLPFFLVCIFNYLILVVFTGHHPFWKTPVSVTLLHFTPELSLSAFSSYISMSV